MSPNFYNWLSHATKVATLIGIAGTTVISIYSLRMTTVVKSDDPALPNRFTKAGKRYLLLLIISTLLTIIVSVLQGMAQGKIDEAERRRELGTFAATVDDQDKVLVKNFNGDLHKSLADADAQISKNETEITDRIRKQSTALQALHDKVLESQDSLSWLTASSARELEAANARVSNLYVEIELIGRNRLSFRVCPTSLDQVSVNPAVGSSRKCQDQKARDALASRDLNESAKEIKEFISGIDPSHHFVFKPVLRLRGLDLWLHLGPCEDDQGLIAPGWCAEPHVESPEAQPRAGLATFFGVSHFISYTEESTGFGFAFDNEAVKKRDIVAVTQIWNLLKSKRATRKISGV